MVEYAGEDARKYCTANNNSNDGKRKGPDFVKNSFLDRLGAIFVPIAAISLRGVAKKGCCSKKVNASEHVLEHMLTCDSEYRRTESLDILMFMLI